MTDLHDALADGDIPVLLMVLHHLTGEERWLEAPYRPIRDPRIFADAAGGLDEASQAEVRAAVAEAVTAYQRGDLVPAAPPDAEGLARLLSVCMGERVPAEYAPMALEEMGLADRDVGWRVAPTPAALSEFQVVVIGAGMSGICAAIKLRALRIPFVILEKNPGVGGTWFENTYPGAGCDVPNHFYSYSFEPNADWPHYFSKQADLRAYFQRAAEKHGIVEDIRFGSEVTLARYDADTQRWVLDVRVADGSTATLQCNVLISAVGQLNRPQTPRIEGLADFAGAAFHSAQWPRDLDLTGKRVGVVGTGASAAQLAPRLAETVGELVIFQRSPQWALPVEHYHRAVSPQKQWLLRNVPYYEAWYRVCLMWRFGDGVWPTLQRDPDWPHPERAINARNDQQRVLLTDYLCAQLDGRPDLIAKALPDYPPYGKRMLIDNNWFGMLRQDNVELVTAPIERATAAGIRTADGAEYELDALVFATGFHARKPLWPMHVEGPGGITLAAEWGEDDPRAHLGMTVPGFPNLFVLYGPNTNLGHGGSIIFHTECQVRYVMLCLREMLEQCLGSLEVRREAYDDYNRRLDGAHDRMIWANVEVDTWYKNRAGRVVTTSPWRLVDYWAMTLRPEFDDFVATKHI